MPTTDKKLVGMAETILIEPEQQHPGTKPNGTLDAEAQAGIEAWYAIGNKGFYSLRGPVEERALARGVGDCWGAGAPCIHTEETLRPAAVMRGVSRAAMTVTMWVTRLFLFFAFLIGTILGTLVTFRLVRPELILRADGPGFMWKKITLRRRPAATPN